ncbi:hypothetical protein N9948_01770 [bacterium]|nr:hypothetical protein [bacterium]
MFVLKNTYNKKVKELELIRSNNKKRVAEIQRELDDVDTKYEALYCTKFEYAPEDIVHNRMCYSTGGYGLCRIIEVDGSWRIIREAEGQNLSVPQDFAEYCKWNKLKKVSKEELIKYLLKKKYILSERK